MRSKTCNRQTDRQTYRQKCYICFALSSCVMLSRNKNEQKNKHCAKLNACSKHNDGHELRRGGNSTGVFSSSCGAAVATRVRPWTHSRCCGSRRNNSEASSGRIVLRIACHQTTGVPPIRLPSCSLPAFPCLSVTAFDTTDRSSKLIGFGAKRWNYHDFRTQPIIVMTITTAHFCFVFPFSCRLY